MYGFASGADRAHFHAHALLVADGNADHRAAIDRRSLELVGRFKMRIEPAIGIHAGIQHQADIVAVVRMRSMNDQPILLSFSSPLAIPEEVLAVLAHRNVGVHAAAVDADHGLGQEARR